MNPRKCKILRQSAVRSLQHRLKSLAACVRTLRPDRCFDAAIRVNFDQKIDKVGQRFGDVEHNFEKPALIFDLDRRNDNDQTVVYLQLGLLGQEVFPIVGDDHIILLGRQERQPTIVRAIQPEPNNMRCIQTARSGKARQPWREALVDKNSIHQAALAIRQSGPIFVSAQATAASIPSSGRLG